jgi:hypothetical protein
MAAGISMIFVGASYALAWILEWLRWQVQSTVPVLISTILISTGLLFHTIHTWLHVRQAIELDRSPLSTLYHWYLVAAWGLAIVCLLFKLVRPATSLGFFLLPLVLLLVAAAVTTTAGVIPADGPVSPRLQMVHGACLLLGTIAIHLGGAMGLMYLWKSYWLKRKVTDDRGLRLPSLEWLQRWAERSLLWSFPLLMAGILLGAAMNMAPHTSKPPLPWSDPMVWTSTILMGWMLIVAGFLLVYPPARTGRKVAFLTLASFLGLVIVLGIPLFTPGAVHTRRPGPEATSGLQLTSQEETVKAGDRRP